MKKLFVAFIVLFVNLAFAKSSYNCIFLGKMDSNWTLTYKFSTKERKETLFSFKRVNNVIISSVDDSIFEYSPTDSNKNINVYKSKDGDGIVISNKTIKVGEARNVEYIRNNKILHRYQTICKRVK